MTGTHHWPRLLAAFALSLSVAGAAQDPPAWTRPTAPFRIVGPIHYVGTEGLAAYLIETRAGAILIDGTMAENVPAIERNIVASGVRLRDVRVMLLTHAHFDHAAGLSGLKKATGARLVVGAADAEAVATGIPPGETSYGVIKFPAAHVDRAIRDGEQVWLGGVVLTAVATPGHTPGCTSWTMRTADAKVGAGRPLDVIFPCSVSVAGNRLVGNRRYPGIVADFRRSLARLATMRADVVLPAHPELGDVLVRQARGGGAAFVDRGQLGRLVSQARVKFDADLAGQSR